MCRKIYKFLTKHRIIITSLIILIMILTPIILKLCRRTMEEIGCLVQIVESIFVVSGVVIAVWQYYIST